LLKLTLPRCLGRQSAILPYCSWVISTRSFWASFLKCQLVLTRPSEFMKRSSPPPSESVYKFVLDLFSRDFKVAPTSRDVARVNPLKGVCADHGKSPRDCPAFKRAVAGPPAPSASQETSGMNCTATGMPEPYCAIVFRRIGTQDAA
jgi:hypothetical protein